MFNNLPRVGDAKRFTRLIDEAAPSAWAQAKNH
jgi:hypothetical protein